VRRRALALLPLAPFAAQAQPWNEPALPLPGGLAPLPGGGWRLSFTPGAAEPTAAHAEALRRIAARLAERTSGRVTLWGEAADAGDASDTRRLSLARARAVAAALEEGGLDPRRMDIRPAGAGGEVVDILPPGVARAAAPR